ncbi:GatB/YqeY domain-containing protein [Hysterangium stoloniferum]|nr:GatB/YqeY domain-containing protein [Hysterangium stoloniferum]
MRSRDSFSSTTIRSVLSEIYAAQKAAVQPLKTPEIVSIIRKAEQRRLDSARQFESASRADLAEKEQKEANLLACYLPTMVPVSEIDRVLRRVISGITEKDNVKKAKGLVLKLFYSEVNKNAVQGEVVKQRLDELWSS